MGEGVGGLLNATFGNAAELIIALAALQKGLYNVVKASLTGSLIGNILLVFGASALAGGFRYKAQKFNRTASSAQAILLTLGAIGLVMPAAFHDGAGARAFYAELFAARGDWDTALRIAGVLDVLAWRTRLHDLATHAAREPHEVAVD